MLPILTRYLSPKDYGIVAMFQVLVYLIAPFTGLSIHGAVSVKYFDRENTDIPKYIGNCFLILFTSSILVGLVFLGLSGPISKLASFPVNWLWAVIVVSFGQFVSQMVLILWQVRIQPLFYGRYQIAQTITNIGLSMVLVINFGLTWKGSILGQAIAGVIFAIIGLMVLKKGKSIDFTYKKDYLTNALKFGIPLIPHALGGFLMTMTDRIFITNMVGINETGIYAVGYQVGLIIGLLENSFNQAWVPWLFSRLKENNENRKRQIVKLTYVYFASILVLALLLSFGAPHLLKYLVGPKFAGANKYIIWIAVGYAFNGMYKMVTNYIFYAEKTYVLAWLTLIFASLNVGFYYIFISKNGAIGAAQATTLAFVLKFIVTWMLSSRIFPMPWNLKDIKNG